MCDYCNNGIFEGKSLKEIYNYSNLILDYTTKNEFDYDYYNDFIPDFKNELFLSQFEFKFKGNYLDKKIKSFFKFIALNFSKIYDYYSDPDFSEDPEQITDDIKEAINILFERNFQMQGKEEFIDGCIVAALFQYCTTYNTQTGKNASLLEEYGLKVKYDLMDWDLINLDLFKNLKVVTQYINIEELKQNKLNCHNFLDTFLKSCFFYNIQDYLKKLDYIYNPLDDEEFIMKLHAFSCDITAYLEDAEDEDFIEIYNRETLNFKDFNEWKKREQNYKKQFENKKYYTLEEVEEVEEVKEEVEEVKEEVESKEEVQTIEENKETIIVTKENIHSIAEKIIAIFLNKTSLSLESCQVLMNDFYRKITSKFNEKLSKKTIKTIEENIYIYRTFTYNFLLNVFNKIKEISFIYTIENNIKQINYNKFEEWMQCQLTSKEFTQMKKSCLNELNKPFELPKSYNKEDLTLIKDFKRDFNNIISFIPPQERKCNNINFTENALIIATKGNYIKYTTNNNNKGGFSVNISEFKKTLDEIKTNCIIKAGYINNTNFNYTERTLDAPIVEKNLTEKGNVRKIIIDSIELTNALKNCLTICLKEKEDSRKQLQMPCLYFDKNKSYLISTDAKQIIKYDLNIINNTYFDKAYNLYIPFDIAKGLLYNLENYKYQKGEDGWALNEKVEIIFHKKYFEIIFNELNIICNYIDIKPMNFTPFLNEVEKCQIIFECNTQNLFKACEEATKNFTLDKYENPIKAFAFIYNGKELILKNDNVRLAIPTFKLNDNTGFNAFNPALIANILKNKNIDITIYLPKREVKNIPLFIKYTNYTYVLMPVYLDFQGIAENELTEIKEVVEENEVKKVIEENEVKEVVEKNEVKEVVEKNEVKQVIIKEITKEKELLIIHNIIRRSRPPPENLRRLSK